MYNKETKNKLSIDIIKRFENNKDTDLSKIVSMKKFNLDPENCARILAYHFPLGLNDVLFHFSTIINKRLHSLSENKLNNLGITEKIRFLVINRLKIISEYEICFNNIKKHLTAPANLLFTNKLLFSISDELWFLAGDKSLDFNFYSKRLILMKIYTKTFFTWIKDNSKDNLLTNETLDMQLRRVSKIGKYKFMIKNFLSNTKN